MTIISPSNGGPDLDQLFLNDQIGPDHEAYAELCERFASSPAGQRIMQFHKQNDRFRDGLTARTHNQLDHIIQREMVVYNGGYFDRIGKIMAIRAHRVELEKEKLRAMTPEEREAYLAEQSEADRVRKTPEQIQAEKDREAKEKKSAERAKKLSLWQQQQAERNAKRMADREAGRAMLDAEAARRKGSTNPMAARKLAEEERRREEGETEFELSLDDADTLIPEGASELAPGGADPAALGRDGPDLTSNDPGANLGAFTIEDRRAELKLLNRDALRDIMSTHKIADSLTETNDKRVEKILAFEYQDTVPVPVPVDPSTLPPADQTPTEQHVA